MKFLLAPNALKGSLSAVDAAAAMAEGVRQAGPGAAALQLPVSDGGDGLVEVLHRALGGELRSRRVTAPRAEEDPGWIDAPFLWLPQPRLAGVETAAASGLARVPEELRDPTRTTSRGTGELISAALDLGAVKVVIGIGGSATVDAGLGVATALGGRFLDRDDRPLEPVGASLGKVRRIDLSGLDPRLGHVRLEVLCDVDNPLLGPQGAAAIYAPQKGASPDQVEALEAGLAHLADRIEEETGRDVRSLPGAGAAGGLGAGLAGFFGAELHPGAERVLALTGFGEQLRDADLVLTAEGRLDLQTLRHGKAPAVVARHARKAGVPCIALAGRVELPEPTGVEDDRGAPTAFQRAGFTAIFSLCPGPVSPARAREQAAFHLTTVTAQVVQTFLARPSP